MKVRNMILAAGAVLTVAGAASAQWTTQTLTDGNASFISPTTMPTSTTSGASGIGGDFRPGGGVTNDQIFTNWWWYRANGDTRERAIAAPNAAAQGAVIKTLGGTNTVTWSNIQTETSGNNVNLRFTLSFTLVDLDGAGSTNAGVATSLTVTNLGTGPATAVSLFSYVDYFLNGQDANDIVPLGNTGVLAGNRFINVNDTLAPGLSMSHMGFGAAAYTVGTFTVVGGQMGDTGVDNFADLNSGTTANDLSGVMQWNFGDIPAGGSATAISHLVIPTPGAAALMGLGLLAAGRRRRA